MSIFMEIYWDFALRLFVAGMMGVAIGLEREYRSKEAGYRTHFMVALGSALMMIVSQYGFDDVLKTDLVRLDPSRVAAQVVSGIGFIGAGTIVLLHKQIVRGLTTAAGIWATAGIGLAIGAGMYVVGVTATVLVLVGLELLSLLFKKLGLRSMMLEFSCPNREVLKKIIKLLGSKGGVIVSYEMEEKGDATGRQMNVVNLVLKTQKMSEDVVLRLLNDFPDVTIHKIV